MHSANSDTLRMTARRAMRDGKSRVSITATFILSTGVRWVGFAHSAHAWSAAGQAKTDSAGDCAAKTGVSCQAVLWHEPCTALVRQEEARARGRNAIPFSECGLS